MQFDEFDNKIKEAADHHHPAYDDQAWAKMEKMLNKHLPQKEEENRRFIFFLLLFLGIGGVFFLIASPWKTKKAATLTAQTASQEKQAANFLVVENNPLKEDGSAEKNKSKEKPIITGPKGGAGDFFSKQTAGKILNNSVKREDERTISYVPIASAQIRRAKGVIKITQADKKLPGEDNSKNERTDNVNSQGETIRTVNNITTDKVVANLYPANSILENDKKITGSKTVIDKKTQKNDSLLHKDKKVTGSKNKKHNFFFVSFSAGPDVSFVKSGKLGNVQLLTGAGFGYTIKDRFTIRAGFYSGNKIYSASADAYHPPSNFYTYYPYLEKVDANCKVYEIPVSLSYNFSHKTNQNWFVSAGISSDIMKRETYDYTYKYTPGGATINRQREIKNKNSHFLSGFTLSGGYQRNITKNISLVIEPFFKMPLSGTGYGKVKLNSEGVLFSIGIKPFTREKNQPGSNL